MVHRSAVLRFDVSRHIGMGHFYRALALAERLDDYLFAVSRISLSSLRSCGVPENKIILVDDDTTWTTKLGNMNTIIFDICRADNGIFAKNEILSLTEKDFQVAVIDSMPPDNFKVENHSAVVPPSWVITPYLFAEKYIPHPFARNWMCGPTFCILGSAYKNQLQRTTKSFRKRKILLCNGGSDPTNLTVRCLDALVGFPGVVDVVVGELFSRSQIRSILDFSGGNKNCNIHMKPKGLASLIAQSDVVIGRPGLLRYECAALGKNAIFLSETSSYEDYFRGFITEGLAEIFFKHLPGQEEAFFFRLSQLCDMDANNNVFHENSRAVALVAVDGAENVIAQLFCSKRES